MITVWPVGTGTRETEVRLDGVKVALGNRLMTVEAARKTGKNGELWCVCN